MRVTLVHYPNLLELMGKGWTESELCRIHNIHSKRLPLDLPDDAAFSQFTVKNLKAKIEDVHGFAIEDQVLRLNGRLLEDKETIAACCVFGGSSILLGLTRAAADKAEKSDKKEDAQHLKTADRTVSQTMTVAEAGSCPVGTSGNSGSGEPWWQGARLSGPQGPRREISTSMPRAEAGDAKPTSSEAETAESPEAEKQPAAPAEELSAVGGGKLIVFDFDQTLSVIHVFKTLAGWNDRSQALPVPEPHASTEHGQVRRIQELSREPVFKADGFAMAAFGGEKRVQEVRLLLRTLTEQNVELVICTKGFVGVARKCLSDLGLLTFFSEVYGNVGNTTYESTPYDKEVARVDPTEEETLLLGSTYQADWSTKDKLISQVMRKKSLRHEQVVLVDDDPEEIRRANAVCRTLWVKNGTGITNEEASKLHRFSMPGPPRAGVTGISGKRMRGDHERSPSMAVVPQRENSTRASTPTRTRARSTPPVSAPVRRVPLAKV